MAGGMRNTFEGDGSYKPESGSFDDLAKKPEAEFRVNLQGIQGAENYRPGDEIVLSVKARVGQAGEQGGMTDMEVIRVTAEPMDNGAARERAREPKVDTAGTLL